MILGVLGRAQHLHPVQVYGFIFLSNHYHMLLSAKDPRQLVAFMCYVNSNIAREVNRLRGRSGALWHRRYRPIAVSEEDRAQVGRLRYLLSNGCKEGLVARPEQWPGVSALPWLFSGRKLGGTWRDRKAACRDGRRKLGAKGWAAYETRYEINLSALPCWAEEPAHVWRREVAELVESVANEAAAQAIRTGRGVLGAAAVLQQLPQSLPKRSSRRPAPRFHAATRAVYETMAAESRAFLSAYRVASKRFRAGEWDVVFPAWAFPPGRPMSCGPPE